MAEGRANLHLRLPSLPVNVYPPHKVSRLFGVNTASDCLRFGPKPDFAVLRQGQERSQVILADAAIRPLHHRISHHRQIVVFAEQVAELIEFTPYPFENGRPAVAQDLHLRAEIFYAFPPFTK
jgi:hypothetical protein